MVTAVGLIPELGGVLTEVELLTDDKLERALDIRDEYTLLLSEPPELSPARQHVNKCMSH